MSKEKTGDIKYVLLFRDKSQNNYILFAYSDAERDKIALEEKNKGHTLVKIYDRSVGEIK